jgi:hypothetical protein
VFVIYCVTAAIWRLQVEWPSDYEETWVQCKDIGGQRCYMEPALISGDVWKKMGNLMVGGGGGYFLYELMGEKNQGHLKWFFKRNNLR